MSAEKKQQAQLKQASRLNFHLLLLQNARFQVTLTKSVDQKTLYAMLTLSEKDLQIQCANLSLSAKLMYSFQRVLFEYKRRHNYEPFRSQMRQEIIRKYISTMIDLDLLVKEKVISRINVFYRSISSSNSTSSNSTIFYLTRSCRCTTRCTRWRGSTRSLSCG